MQHTTQDNIHDTDLLNAVASFLRRLHIMYQAWKWSRTARLAIKNRDIIMAEIAIEKFDQLNDML